MGKADRRDISEITSHRDLKESECVPRKTGRTASHTEGMENTKGQIRMCRTIMQDCLINADPGPRHRNSGLVSLGGTR